MDAKPPLLPSRCERTPATWRTPSAAFLPLRHTGNHLNATTSKLGPQRASHFMQRTAEGLSQQVAPRPAPGSSLANCAGSRGAGEFAYGTTARESSSTNGGKLIVMPSTARPVACTSCNQPDLVFLFHVGAVSHQQSRQCAAASSVGYHEHRLALLQCQRRRFQQKASSCCRGSRIAHAQRAS